MQSAETNSPLKREDAVTVDDLEHLCARVQSDPWNLSIYTKGIYIAVRLKHDKYLEYLRTQCVKHCVVEDRFWLTWIEDKRRDSSDDDIISMYECAVDNEPSADIWIAYVRFERRRSLPDCNLGRMRSLFERGLKSVGLHALDGPLLWSEYRQFEQELLESCDESDYGNQLERVRALFFRQLGLPLAGLPDLLDEYRVWESELPKEYRRPVTEGELIHKLGFDAWERRKCFELKVQSEFDEILNPGKMNNLWNEYLDFELECGDRDRITIVYMRALDDLGYERDDLWMRFSRHALSVSDKFALWVCERSSRHMPRSVNIWINYLQMIVSVPSTGVEELVEVFDRAVTALTETSSLISLHITAADCLRRHHPESIEVFRRILLRQEDLLSKMGDFSCDAKGTYRLLTYWGRQELRLLMSNKGTLENYLEVIKKLLQRFVNDSQCWLFVIEGVKSLDACGKCDAAFMSSLIAAVCRVVAPKSSYDGVPKSAHDLIMWLFDTAHQFLSAGDISESYIDYAQTCGDVEDIKRAHMTAATQSHQSETRCTGSTLSLNNIILRRDHRRRRQSESYSETSSDSGSCSHRYIKSSCRVRSETSSVSIPSPKLSMRDMEFATRATWDGNESADPSIAPAVPPSLTMPPPPPSSLISKFGSQFAMYQGVLTPPDSSPDMKYTPRSLGSSSMSNLSMLPQSMMSVSDGQLSGVNKRPYDDPYDSSTIDSERISRIQLLLSSDRDVLNSWLSGGGHRNTLWVSKVGGVFEESELNSRFSSLEGFKSIRLLPSGVGCHIEFDNHDNALRAKTIVSSMTFDNCRFECELCKPSKVLYDDKVLFVKRISDIVPLNQGKITQVLRQFFCDLGYEPVNIRFPSIGVDGYDGECHTRVPDYCYVSFKEDDSARLIINKLLSSSGTLSCTLGDVGFDVSPSTPMFRKRLRLGMDSSYKENDSDLVDSSD
ncbi:Squamous cell carcinoma antigen recognized by T-cells 3 [Babesia sp. Xinjiang]|uniref:Squamous cell carcinoma antigen recognized by T-cells 3 n=1 Tax=Babesia sp. Xinjiang TaxID=462227 RepID=UPI000A258E5F|nr:Squamous cell carcinoma antigen recognized by T-cells 3 [Babesia sp. Xinjiang]ORM40012.1 Squamous cell carcinoma antigen recognized by T-cells 3 [Babesia sp. Xinjiang]